MPAAAHHDRPLPRRGIRVLRRSRLVGAVLASVVAAGALVAQAAPASANTPMNLTWPRTAPSIRYIDFENDANLNYWPVIVAANRWNDYLAVNHVPIRFRHISTCQSGVPTCFKITESSASLNGVVGGRASWGNYLGHISRITSYVIYDNGTAYRSTSYNVRIWIVMHEFGHTLGLSHSLTSGRLMFEKGYDTSATTPSVDDMLSLIAAYN
jgi:hypothetical protein